MAFVGAEKFSEFYITFTLHHDATVIVAIIIVINNNSNNNFNRVDISMWEISTGGHHNKALRKIMYWSWSHGENRDVSSAVIHPNILPAPQAFKAFTRLTGL